MKNKQFTLLAFGILASLFLIGMTSAAITLYPDSYSANAAQGNSVSFTFKIYNDGTSSDYNLTNLGLTKYNLINGSNILPSSNIALTHSITKILNKTNSSDITVTVSVPSSQSAGLYVGNIMVSGDHEGSTGSPASRNISLSINVIGPEESEEISSCTSNPGELKIKKIEFTNNGISSNTFGEDDKWLPYENIEAVIKVENNGGDDIENIELKWGIYDADSNKWVIELDEEDEFDINEDKDEELTISFSIDDDLDVDLEDLNGGTNFRFYVIASGDVDNSSELKTCVTDYKSVEIIIEDDFVIANNLAVPESVNCGSTFELAGDILNIGKDEQKDVSINVYNQDLGIDEDINLGDIDAFDNAKLNILLNVPENAEDKVYTLEVSVLDNSNEIYEYDNEESTALVDITVSGMCKIDANTKIDASLVSGVKAGEEFVVKTTLKNNGKKTMTFTLNPTGYTDWATSAKINQTSVTLKAGESKDVLVTLATKKSVSGEKTFNVDLLVGDQVVMEQPITVKLAKSGFSLTDVQGSNQTLIMALVTLILIVAIITVAVRVSRK